MSETINVLVTVHHDTYHIRYPGGSVTTAAANHESVEAAALSSVFPGRGDREQWEVANRSSVTHGQTVLHSLSFQPAPVSTEDGTSRVGC